MIFVHAPWNAEQVQAGIQAIALRGNCLGCNAEWEPWGEGQRIMNHADICPYSEAIWRLGL